MSPVFVAGIFLAMSGGCTKSWQATPETPVAKVNDHALRAKEFGEKLAERLKVHDALTAKDPQIVETTKNEVLREFIISSLIEDFASANQLTVTPVELSEEIKKVRSTYKTDLDFRQMLVESRISMEEFEAGLRKKLIQKKFFSFIQVGQPPLSDSELRQHYQQRKAHLEVPERLFVRQIVVKDIVQANELKEALKKRNMESLAKLYSIAPEGKNGGLVGWVDKGTFEPFDKANQLPLGQVSTPLESPYGFHLVKIERRALPRLPSFEEARPQMMKELQSQREQAAFASWLDRQLRASRVSQDLDLMKLIKVETRRNF